nr:F104 [uncultured bacterium]
MAQFPEPPDHPAAAQRLKDLLASAPLEDVDLTRSEDIGRDVDL